MSHSLASLFFLSREARKSVLRGKTVNLARQDSQSWRPTLTVLRCKKVNLAMQNSQSCIVFPPFSAVRDIRFVVADVAMHCLTASCGKRRRIVCTPPPSPSCTYRRFSCAVKVHNLAVASNSAALSALSFVRRVFHIVLVQAVCAMRLWGRTKKPGTSVPGGLSV